MIQKLAKAYFIKKDHILSYSLINKTTTYDDPRAWGSPAAEEVAEPREVALSRHPQMGFGFVAGSEKPVVVRWKVMAEGQELGGSSIYLEKK